MGVTVSENEQLSNLRDFVYLDVERVKSAIAQLHGGVVSDLVEGSEASTARGGRAGLRVFADVGVEGSYATVNRSTETRTLHDFVYTDLESSLIENHALKIISADGSQDDEADPDQIREELTPIDYVLVKGQVRFLDYGRMEAQLANFNDLVAAIGFFYR